MLNSQVLFWLLLTLHQAYHRELLEQMIASGRRPPSTTDAPPSRKLRPGSRKAPPSKKPSVKRKKEKKSSSRRRVPKPPPVAGGMGAMWRKVFRRRLDSHTPTLIRGCNGIQADSIRAGACNCAPAKVVHSYSSLLLYITAQINIQFCPLRPHVLTLEKESN
jgi:hypothetical protein